MWWWYLEIFVIAFLILVSLYIFKNKLDKKEDITPMITLPNVIVNLEDLEKHAEKISKYYSDIKKGHKNKMLLEKLKNNYESILDTYNKTERYQENYSDILHAGEWLLDNMFLIRKEYKELKNTLTSKYYKNLPLLSKGIMRGYPRIYHIAVEMVSHSDGYINEDIIEKFLNAYQKNTILTSKELLSLPVMIKVALIENIRKITDTLKFIQDEKIKADSIAERIINCKDEEDIKNELNKMSQEDIEFTPFFIERLFKLLKDNGVESSKVYNWIDEKLEINELNYENIIVEEHKEEAAMQVTIGNCINSIRRIEGLNYRKYFERLSYVEQLLKKDPVNVYEKMDIESKNYYRHSIEKLSKKYKLPESFIVKKALECANEAKDSDKEYEKHIGYYLIDDGVKCLKQKLNVKQNVFQKIFECIIKNKVDMYLLTIIIGTLLLIYAFVHVSLKNDNNIQIWRYIIAVLVLIIPISEIVISFVNYSINLLVPPRIIPKLNLKNSIDDENRTIIIVPTIISNLKNADKLIEKLEVSYLSNSDDNLYFAILGDFKDSNIQHEENDDKITQYVLNKIQQLNIKYCKNDKNKFFYLSRYRKYNEREHKWLAYERKRGKIMEFIQLLKGKNDTSYNVISSDISELKKAKYILTLDSDTKLPRDTASKLVGAMAHVLNRPVVDAKKNRVIRGYGLLQPRISISLNSSNKTFFSKIFSGETGIDVYTTAVSDVYQDLFGEGTFVGKGIFDIDVFYTMLNNKIPDNSVLSHDLLEGCYVKTGLVSDIELIDDYPSYYSSSCKRLHRWVRGDWQLIPWIFKNKDLNKLSKFKLIDNLRRSLLSVSIITLVILSFHILPDGTDKWIVASILSLICPIIFNVSQFFVFPKKGVSLSGRIINFKMVIFQIFFIVCFLPHKAILMLDAIFRTLYRLTVTKEHLLEWQTAEEAEKNSFKTLKSYIKLMWSGSAIGILIMILSFNESLEYGLSSLPFCLIWAFSPLIAYKISKESNIKKDNLNKNQRNEVSKISRRIYAYFEDFVNEKTNYLPPDNYQEYPKGKIAYRTSPTNLGMGLMANIAGFDLGYIGILKLIQNLENTLNSMDKLEKFNGHYYNWYDIKSMQPLHPRYISTVDSGNLVGYLWVISQSLKEYCDTKIDLKKYINGLKDVASIAEEELNVKDYFCSSIDKIQDDIDIYDFYKLIISLNDKTNKTLKSNQNYWVIKLKGQLEGLISEFEYIFPWIKEHLKDNERDYKIIKLLSQLSINQILNMNDDSESIKSTKESCNFIIKKVNDLIDRVDRIAKETDFSIVFDAEKKLFSIGYDIENNNLSKSYYDLLASEARQASFVAIAKGDIEQENWFKLGRSLTLIGNGKGLISWSGTMFEYFMPLLIMKNYPNTLFSETYNFVLQGQKKYCVSKNVPWGVSESAFYYFDSNLNYQYKAFGIPGIGVKRGLSNELVIAPYATFLAMQINHRVGYENIIKLMEEGVLGKYGFYEAIDYTKNRIKGKKKAVINSFMVHHEGMSIMAIDNILNDNVLQRRFHSIPEVKATELLLQERPSKNIVYKNDDYYIYQEKKETQNQPIIVRKFNTPNTLIPQVNLLSNGELNLMISNSGSGYTKKGDVLLYRYKNDVTLDSSGMFFYIKDVLNNTYFSATYEPCKVNGEFYNVEFSLDKAVFKRKDKNLITKTEVIVSNEDNADIRKISITNDGEKEKIVEVTSYCEVTLSRYFEDLAHPSFQDLFIQTEYLDDYNCVIAKRRCRKKEENEKWIMQTVAVKGESIGSVQYETSKANFVGRGHNLKNPICMESDAALKNTTGIVLCPIISIRRRVKIAPHHKCQLVYTTAIGNSKDEIINLAKKYNEYSNTAKAFKLAYTQCQLDIKYLGIKSAQANLYQMAASKILFLDLYNHKNEAYVKNIKGHQEKLWKYNISGDLPIMLVICKQNRDIHIVRQILKAYEYYDLKGLKTDLVIINMQDNSYDRPLENYIKDLILSSVSRDKMNKKGGIFLINKSSITEEDLNLLKGIAKITADSEQGLFVCKISDKNNNAIKKLKKKNIVYETKKSDLLNEKLKYFNGYGGFSQDGERYIILLDDDKNTPLPWINVISNEKFGFIVSERGSMYTWNLNSRENKLTTWSNDWVSDWCDENIYIRDEINGDVWSVTCNPIRTKGEYLIEHGFGYSTFKHNYNGIECQLTAFVPRNENVKICIMSLKNDTDKTRKLSLTYFAKLVLGTMSEQTSQYISTYIDKENKYIYGINPYNKNFGNLKAYLKIIGGSEESFTGDRTGFVGRCGDYTNPTMLSMESLSNKVGANMEACLAENSKFNIDPSKTKNIIILFGEESNFYDINKVIQKYSSLTTVMQELKDVKYYWKNLLNTVQVNTPDDSMNIMLNGWLMYQTISCRIWARTAFYQCGGAYGFRDQLQDTLNAIYINPELTRSQIIYSASKQYLEGDVQHWWHPIVNSGIRTRYSDDLLWLPYVTANYIKATCDYDILDEIIPYLEDEPLKENEDERYKIVNISDQKGTLYEHCLKAIDKALRFGEHNIPLMGSGDWNDGMNKVGNKGKGESVWLGFFLYNILDEFIPICDFKNDKDKKNRYVKMKQYIKDNIEKNAWDGNWYKRAFFDDGTPLGSVENDECQIDSISQSWSVISKCADINRAKMAMESLENNLVKKDKGMILLLNPPFDKSHLEPGYIKGYVPGVRENGGQYTHAAAWVILAFSKLNMEDKAWKLFNLINPINHTSSYFECQNYKAEPYVMAADVYAKEPHQGRGGWTWYTGSAGWMYRAGIEGILGLKFSGKDGFLIKPCIPKEWNGYTMTYKRGNSIYNIKVKRNEKAYIKVDNDIIQNNVIPYFESGKHDVEVYIPNSK